MFVVSALIEADKNYTQNIADSLVVFNERCTTVHTSLETKVNTLDTLNKGNISKIICKDRKTIDERDTLINTLYEVSLLINHDFQSTLEKPPIWGKKEIVKEIISALRKVGKVVRSLEKDTDRDVQKKILESENLQSISKSKSHFPHYI